MVATSRDILASPPPPTLSELQRIAAGDQHSCRALIDRWETTIRIIASAYASRRSPLPDLVQVGRIAVYKAALKYDVGCGSPFANYTKRAIKNAVIQEAIRLSRQWKFSSPFEGKCEKPDSRPLEVPHDGVGLVREWASKLTEPYATVFRMIYVERLKQRAVAEKLEVSQPRVAQLHRSLLELARAALAS